MKLFWDVAKDSSRLPHHHLQCLQKIGNTWYILVPDGSTTTEDGVTEDEGYKGNLMGNEGKCEHMVHTRTWWFKHRGLGDGVTRDVE